MPDDEEVVTAEWLESIGYVRSVEFLDSPRSPNSTVMLGFSDVEDEDICVCVSMSPNREWEYDRAIFFNMKTRGQVRAWHKAFNQPLNEAAQ